MEELLAQYRRTILKRQEEFEESHPEVVPKTCVEQIHDWEDWAYVHYTVPDAVQA